MGRKALVLLAALPACALAAGQPAARAAAAAAPQECLTTPAVDTTKYFGTAGGQPWDGVQAYFAAASVDFDDGISDNSPARLCLSADSSCVEKKLWIQPEHRANCLRPEDFDGQLRIVGRIRGRDARLLPAYGFAGDNVDSIVYLLVRDRVVYALYRAPNSVTRFAPQPRGMAPGWRFAYDTSVHSHGGGVPGGPAALWRDTTVRFAAHHPAAGARLASGPAAPGIGDLAGAQLTTLQYGWMACASGCCQFQGTGDGPAPGPDVHHQGPPPGPPGPPPGPPGPPPGPPPAPPRR